MYLWATTGGTVGAKEVAKVEGISLETMGMIVYGVVSNSLCLDWIM